MTQLGPFEYNFGDSEVLLVACSLMALPFMLGREDPRTTSTGHTESARSRPPVPGVGRVAP